MQIIEIVAVVLGIACVWLTVRQHIGCWPTGLAMVSLYIVIFYRAKLYSDMLLQIVYVFLQIYGWYAWCCNGPQQTPLQVSYLRRRTAILWVSIAAVASVLLGAAMSQTDASFPYVDAFTTVTSLIAQWLMARKVLESWLFWIVVDVISIGLYAAKGLYLTTGLYTIFLTLATLGYFAWRRTVLAPATAWS